MKLKEFFNPKNLKMPLRDQEGGTNVSEQFDHYITRNIKASYKKRAISPLIYLILLLVLSLIYPIRTMTSPTELKGTANLLQVEKHANTYVSLSMKDLYFTGYTKKFLDRTTGYYYYTIMDDKCVVVLLSPTTSEQGKPTIDKIHIRARILRSSNAKELLLGNLAKDLKWDADSVAEAFYPLMISEPDATGLETRFLVAVISLTGLYALISLILDLLYIAIPEISTPVRRLAAYGNPKKLLDMAEEEIATVPQLATEDMFITEHFFIETSSYGVALVPIDQILWIYKYSTLHKFLWHHFSITYTLYINARHRQTIHCPKNIKSDIDGIMDYLAEANHDILVGFTEKNRLAVEEKQGDIAPLRKFWALLSHMV